METCQRRGTDDIKIRVAEKNKQMQQTTDLQWILRLHVKVTNYHERDLVVDRG